jgi:hypothetical protein
MQTVHLASAASCCGPSLVAIESVRLYSLFQKLEEFCPRQPLLSEGIVLHFAIPQEVVRQDNDEDQLPQAIVHHADDFSQNETSLPSLGSCG